MSERGHRRFHRFAFGFGCGFPGFGFYFGRPWRFGTWGWGFHPGFPDREEYRQMLEDYKGELEDYRRELDGELKRVEDELERLRQEG